MATTIPADRTDAPVPPEESLPRKRGNPLLWLLLLLAVLAAIWFLYNRSASNATVDTTSAAPVIITGDAQQAAAQAERAQANAASARKTARAERASSERTTATRIADRGPELIARVQPKYPPIAYRNREEGSVLVRANVDANGVPGEVTLVRRSGSRDLDNAALAAVRQWHFRPAIENGKAIASAVEVPVDFKLGEQ